MTADNRVEQLLETQAGVDRRRLWADLLATDSAHDFAQRLKQSYSIKMHADPQVALRIVGLMRELGELAAEPTINALALRSEANIRTIALGQHNRALDLFAQATELYAQHQQTVEIARIQSGRVWALSNLERYADAIAAGESALSILEDHGERASYHILANNMAMVHNRYGKPQQSLPLLEAVREQFRQSGPHLKRRWVGNAGNHIYVLCMLGRFEDALEVGREAAAVAESLDQPVLMGLIKQNLALTYSISGQFNRALQLYDEAIAIWDAAGWTQGLVQVEVGAAFCLLRLRRFWDVVRRFERVHQLCQLYEVLPDTPYSLLWEAKALAGLERYGEALETVGRVADIIASDAEDRFGMAVVDLARAELLFQQGDWAACEQMARQATVVFAQNNRPLEAAEGLLMQARALLALGQPEQATAAVRQGMQLAETHRILSVMLAGETLLGRIATEPEEAFVRFERALGLLRQLQAGVMLEFRPNFLQDADKQQLSESMVQTCLTLGRVDQALSYIEEAKSRSLLAMVAQRLTLRLEARQPADAPLVASINTLTAERNALYRQLQQAPKESKVNREHLLLEQQKIEAELTELRNTLLIRNADYVRELSLDEMHVTSAQPHLDSETLLVEYFTIGGQIVALCVSANTITAHTFTTSLKQVQRNQYALNVNFKTIPRLSMSRVATMTRHAQKSLHALYKQLIGPIAAQVAGYRRLIIVPHDSLHYLPFHALFDGRHYLAETHTLSYLPASSFLAYANTQPSHATGMLTIGYSHSGMLPQAVDEAKMVAAECESALLLEEAAQRETIMQAVKQCNIVHIATHGEFRADNPLFSGLALQDGWLTTLDIFNMRLPASLVTLSGCHTGRSLIGGGDELLGLTRAFLAAGVRSLVLSHWAVEDTVTAELMRVFYRVLISGATKGDALQQAQRHLLHTDTLPRHVRHPYFWAPFYLVGAADRL